MNEDQKIQKFHRGYTVIRFQNDDVMNRLGDVLRSIMEKMLE
jgi:very-short-patch-repair endonuclease